MDRREGRQLLEHIARSVDVDRWLDLHAILSETNGEQRFVGHPAAEQLSELLAKREEASGAGAGRVNNAQDRRLAFDTQFTNCAGIKVL